MDTADIVSVVVGLVSLVMLIAVLVLLQKTYTITRRAQPPAADPKDTARGRGPK